MIKRAIWLPLGLIAAVALGLTALFASPAEAQAPDVTITVGSTTCAPSSTGCTVDLTVTPAAGIEVGALDLTVTYDDTLLTGTSCTTSGAGVLGVCNATATATTMTFGYASASSPGITGDVGDLEFTTLATETDATLTPTITGSCADLIGDPLNCVVENGTITITSATPTPSPTPAPTDTPAPTATAVPATATPTPGTLPPTGGDSGSSALPLFLAAMGIAALTAGAWAVTRLRRVQA